MGDMPREVAKDMPREVVAKGMPRDLQEDMAKDMAKDMPMTIMPTFHHARLQPEVQHARHHHQSTRTASRKNRNGFSTNERKTRSASVVISFPGFLVQICEGGLV